MRFFRRTEPAAAKIDAPAMRDDLDDLWASLIESVHLDLLTHTFTVLAKSLDHGVTTIQSLECRNVRELRFFNDLAGPWEVVEISEALAERVPLGVRVEFEFWTSGSGLSITAEEVILDGEHVLAE